MSKMFELPHIGQMEFSAELESKLLNEYKDRGRVELKEYDATTYFSAFKS